MFSRNLLERTPGAAGTHRRAWILSIACYLALTIAFTWPVLLHMRSVLPHDAADPALNTWILWWDAHVMPLTTRWWNAPIFWPVNGALAFSEHLVGISVFTTPMQWLGASGLTAYNAAFVASFPLAAVAMHLLTFSLVRRHDAAAVSSLIFAFNPYRLGQTAHIQMMWGFWMPFALWAAHRYIETRRAVWLAAFAASWVLQALANGYCLLFFPVLLACWVVWFAVPRSRADAITIAVTFAGASLLLVPFLLGYQRIFAALGLERGITEIVRFSADVTSLMATDRNAVWGSLLSAANPERGLFPGFVVLVLYVVGWTIALGDARRRNPSSEATIRPVWLALAGIAVAAMVVAVTGFVLPPWRFSIGGRTLLSVSSGAKPLTIALGIGTVALVSTRTFFAEWCRRTPLTFYLCGAALMFAFALGPFPRFHEKQFLYRGPYWLLLQLPGFASVRVPARFAMLFVLCLAVVAAFAFDRLTSSLAPRVRALAGAAAAVVILAESWSSVPAVAQPEAIEMLRSSDTTIPIVQLPFDPDSDVAAVYRSMDNRRPLVNGYSGYIPPHYLVLLLALRSGDVDVLKEFAIDSPVEFVVNRHIDFERWSETVERFGARPIQEDRDWRRYRLEQQPLPPLPSSATLPLREVTANAGVDWVPRMTDGNLATEWNSRRAQAGGEKIVIDLGRDRYVARIEMALGEFRSDFPRQFTVECASGAGAWASCWSGSAGRVAVRAMLDDARNPVLRVPIDRDGVRRLRIRQTGTDQNNGWSIAELAVRGR